MSRIFIFTIFLCLKHAVAYSFPLTSEANSALYYVFTQMKKLCSFTICWVLYGTPEPVQLSYLQQALIWIGWSEEPQAYFETPPMICGGYVFTICAILFIIYLTVSRHYAAVARRDGQTIMLPFLADNDDADEGEYEMEMYHEPPKSDCMCDVCMNEAGDMKLDDPPL